MQPIHPIEHALRVIAPLSRFEHATTDFAVSGTSVITPCGHCFAHSPQPMQLSASTNATPRSSEMAFCGQTAAQSP